MSTEKSQDEKQLDKLENIFDTTLDMDTSLIYKPVDIGAVLIFVFFVHLFLTFVNLYMVAIFDIFAFYFLFQIVKTNTERAYQGIANHNKDIEELKKKVKKLSKK